MELNEAVETVRTLKGRYQAFEKIEEVLVEVAQAKEVKGELKKEIESLKAEQKAMAKAVDDQGKAMASLEKRRLEVVANFETADNVWLKKKAEVEALFTKDSDELKLRFDQYSKHLEETRADLEEKHKQRVQAMENELQGLLAAKQRIQDELRAIHMEAS
jgi:chromosome segregation ATPase